MISTVELQRLRHIGDPEADRAVSLIVAESGDKSAIQAIRAMMSDPGSASKTFQHWRRAEDVDQPEWADPKLIEEGRAVFHMWSMQIGVALACASLPSTYAGANGVKVLVAVSDLANGNANRRLAETVQMLLNIHDDESAGGPFSPGSTALSTLRSVRLFHAAVRHDLQSGLVRDVESWDEDAYGLPVNQEDLIGTLCSFTTVVFKGLSRIGVRLSKRECQAYVHLWSVVGWHLGIRSLHLPLDPSSAQEWERAISDHQYRPSEEGMAITAALVGELERQLPESLVRTPSSLIHFMAGQRVARMLAVQRPLWWVVFLYPVGWLGRIVTPIPGVRRICGWPLKRLGGLVLAGFVLQGTQGAGVQFIVPQLDSEPSGQGEVQ
jgi:ER-bound oxygenase mpaB/B'/Rubber oxygenase, catalytic domain